MLRDCKGINPNLVSRIAYSLMAFSVCLLLTTCNTRAVQSTLTPQQREEIFNKVWTRVKESHFDPKMNGIDWNAVRKQYAPRVKKVKSDGEFYVLLEAMLGELKQSHYGIIPPNVYVAEDEGAGVLHEGETGLTVQLVENQAVITRVAPNSPAEKAGLRPGYAITQIDGKPVEEILSKIRIRKLAPVEERLQVYIALRVRLSGNLNEKRTLQYLDANDKPQAAELGFYKPEGKMEKLGEMPAMRTEFEKRRLAGNIGYIRFNLFLIPVMEPVKEAIREFKDAPGIIIDLRGNLGGIGYMSVGIAGELFDKRVSLGTMKLRQGDLRLAVFPQSEPYKGSVVILTDEASISTSEIMAGGLQELGRAIVVGRATPGMVLPSQFERLPGGARMQFVFADYKTPKGIMLEGRGVMPNIPVNLTRRELLEKGDPTLEIAIEQIVKRSGNEGGQK
jgi:carboxyl-terminal processing protease